MKVMKVVRMTSVNESVLENFIEQLSNELQVKFEKTEPTLFQVEFQVGEKYKSKTFFSYSFRSISSQFLVCFLPHSIDTVELYKINIVRRGEGFGTNLMNQILDVSDRMGIKIKLVPVDYDRDENSPKNYLQKLKGWYTEMGFERPKFPSIDPYYTYSPSVVEYKMVG